LGIAEAHAWHELPTSFDIPSHTIEDEVQSFPVLSGSMHNEHVLALLHILQPDGQPN
jgi:hypothetical protein